MSLTEPSIQPVESNSTAKTEFFSAATAAEQPVQGSNHPTTDVAPGAGSPEPVQDPASPAGSRRSTHTPVLPQYSVYEDEDGRPYLKDAHGARYEIVREGIPMHHSTLFGVPSRDPSSESDIELTELTPASGEMPELALDIDPDQLSTHQLSIPTQRYTRALGISELPRASIDCRYRGTPSRHRGFARLDPRSKARLKETGASNARITEILQTMNKNGGAHRVDRPAPTQADNLTVAPREPIPASVQSAIDATLTPRHDSETHDSFERRARAALRTKEGALTAFPLPTAEPLGVGSGPRTRAFVPLPENYQSVGSASRAHLRFEETRSMGEFRRARMLDHEAARTLDVPVAMNNSASAYASGVEGHRNILSEFADNAEDAIREIIEGKVGVRVPLPADVRSPKVAEPHKYRGQDDHDLFTMDFLEKLLGWYRSNNFGGEDLDYFRVVLLQNYLEGEAHRWYVTETHAYAKENGGGTPEFADVICALHRRFIKSSSAQRATRAYNAVRWKPDSGPEALYSDLKEAGDRMVDTPVPAAMRLKFMELLPTWITRELRMSRGITAELTSYETIRTHARQVWEVDIALKEEDAAQRAAAGLANAPRTVEHRDGRARTYRDHTREAPRETRDHPRDTPRDTAREPTRESPREPRTRDGPRNEKDMTTRRATHTSGCFNCGGTDHFARDKKCPNYPGGNVAKPRVAAQRVLESYSDEDTDEASDLSVSASEEEDANTAPDLDELLAMAEEEEDRAEERMAAMGTKRRVRHFYSMRVVEEDETEEPSDGESSVTASSVPASEESELSEGQPPAYDEEHVVLGNYNQGPNCLVRATAENGLGVDQEYSVCQHLAHLEHRPDSGETNAPRIGVTQLPPLGGSPEQNAMEFEGYELNWLGESDFELGTIIDITVPLMAGCESAQEEIMWHERARANAGLRPLTALEYDANLKWLAKYRDYTPSHDDQMIEGWKDATHQELLDHPVYGSGARALE
ncbi:hypothetical protein C8F04DRAFT_1200378, partial [Mycena alexandri]